MADHSERAESSRCGDNTATLKLVLSVILLVTITAAVYSSLVTHEFSNWDDPKHIAAIWPPSWQRAWKIITDWDLSYTGVTYYSPLHFLSLMADQALIGPSLQPQPWISKLMNIVYHAANTVLVLFLFYSLGLGRRAALLGALLFGVHPLQMGTVAWVAERKNLLGCFFYLAGFLGFVQYLQKRRPSYVLLTVGCFCAGLLSKPSVVTLPVILAIFYLFAGQETKDQKAPYGLFIFLVAAAVGWGLYTMSLEVTYEGMLPPVLYRPLLASGALLFYIGKFLYPATLVPVYPKWDVQGHVILFLAAFGALVGATVILGWLRSRVDRLILFGLAFFVINVLPIAGLVPFGYMSHSFVADHLTYLPLVGLALVAARGFEILLQRVKCLTGLHTVILAGAYVLVCALGTLSIRQSLIWHDPITLWKATLKVNTRSAAVYNNYGLACLAQGRLAQAEELFQKALELFPGLAAAYQNLGRIYYARGNRKAAREMFEKAQWLKPEDNFPRLMLATMLREQGKYDEAIAFLSRCIRHTPGSYVLRLELARTFKESGRLDEALKEVDAAIKVDPLSPLGFMNKAIILLQLNRPNDAESQLRHSVANGETAQARNLLGLCHLAQGEPEKGLREFLRAYEIDPRFPAVRNNVAKALIQMHKPSKAQEFCTQAAREGRPCSEAILKQLSQSSAAK
jgi:tetratricopeptide (TPR) repeat protein